jgi:hypothetical protein
VWGSHRSRRCVSKPGRLRGDCRNAFNSEYSRPVTYRRSGVANKLLSAFGPGVARNPGYRQALIEASIVTNAALSAYSIQQEFVSHDLPELQAVYGVYVLETREVWAPRSDGIKATGLASPPRDLAGFAALADAVVQSERIASYLKSGISE